MLCDHHAVVEEQERAVAPASFWSASPPVRGSRARATVKVMIMRADSSKPHQKVDYQCMSPPTEQLVRDYLNRLSVAARHELNVSDRQVLLDQIRARIEAESGGVRRASPAHMRMILAGFGDPIAVVEAARVRIATGESVTSPGVGAGIPHEPGEVAVSEPDESDISPGGDAGLAVGDTASLADGLRTRLTSMVGAGRESGFRTDSFERFKSASDRAQRGDLLVVSDPSAAVRAGVPGPAPAPEIGPDPAGTAAEPASKTPRTAPETAQAAPEAPGSEAPGPVSEARSALTGQRLPVPGVELPLQRIWSLPAGREDNGQPVPALAAPTRDIGGEPGEDPDDGGRPPGSPAPDPAGSGPRSFRWPHPTRVRRLPGRQPARPWAQVLARLLELALRHKLESATIVLLGIGGAIFPPVWLLGAALALPSRQWDARDKWTGLVLPAFLLIIGTVAIVVFGGAYSSLDLYVREAWQGAVLLSRVLALLSAGYLLLRLYRGRRAPKEPPWTVPRRL